MAHPFNSDISNAPAGIPESDIGSVGGVAPFSTALTGKQVWVDSVNGVDATGARGRRDKPFLTLTAAKTAAAAGDLICVLPGTYNPTATLLKNGVNWQFYPGAVVTVVTDSETDFALFDDAGGAVSSVISGDGEFNISRTSDASDASANLLKLSAASAVEFSAKSATLSHWDYNANCVWTSHASARALVRIRTIDCSGGNYAALTTSGRIDMADGAVTGGNDKTAYANGGTLVISRCNISHSGQGACLEVANSGSIVASGLVVSGDNGYGIVSAAGSSYMESCDFNFTATSQGLVIAIVTGSSCSLKNVKVVAPSGDTNSIGLAQGSIAANLKVYGAFSNKAVDAAVTQQVGTVTVSANVS